MKLLDIFSDIDTKIFVVVDRNDDNELNWIIKPTKLMILPKKENIYVVKAKQVFADKTVDCYITVVTPERISEKVIKRHPYDQPIVESFFYQKPNVIAAVASDCSGNYELYYAKKIPK